MQFTPLQVSKWIKLPFLIDHSEMCDLFAHLPTFKLYDVQKVVGKEEGVYAPELFLEKYRSYCTYLQQGTLPSYDEFRSIFSAVWSTSEEALFAIEIDSRRLWKMCQPVVQCQNNQIRYDSHKEQFLTQIYSSDAISWGIQLGFPHLYVDSSYAIGKTDHFPNKTLFTAIQRWLRQHSVPTPFLIDKKRLNSPIRLGKKCFSWIASHPQLVAQNIEIECHHV